MVPNTRKIYLFIPWPHLPINQHFQADPSLPYPLAFLKGLLLKILCVFLCVIPKQIFLLNISKRQDFPFYLFHLLITYQKYMNKNQSYWTQIWSFPGGLMFFMTNRWPLLLLAGSCTTVTFFCSREKTTGWENQVLMSFTGQWEQWIKTTN